MRSKRVTQRERSDLIDVGVALSEIVDEPALNLASRVSILFQIDLQQQTAGELSED